MDYSEIIDATTPVAIELFGKVSAVCHVYTAGWERLTTAQRALVLPLAVKLGVSKKRSDEITAELDQLVPEDRRPALETEQRELGVQSLSETVAFACAFIPLMASGIEVGDSPLTFRGKFYPDYVSDLPERDLIEIANKLGAAMENPSSGETSESISPPEDAPELSQIESIAA